MIYSTQILPAGDPLTGHGHIQTAASTLRNGSLVAIPTETVYGLAANALDEKAVSRIFEVKGRPADNPLIVHIAHISELNQLAADTPISAQQLAQNFWPGPLTMILPSSSAVPALVRAGLDTVAVRMPSHPIALQLIKAAGIPLAAPSANLSGRPSPTTAAHCLKDLDGLVPIILDGGPCGVGVESTVVSLTGGIPQILRPGAVTPEQIKSVLGAVMLDPAVYHEPAPSSPVASPGLKHTHYSPKAKVTVLRGQWENCAQFLEKHREDGAWALVFEQEMDTCPIPALCLGPKDSPDIHARRLFSLLRELDEKDAKIVFARAPREEGLGLAVYNRLLRAAGFNELTVDN